MTVEGRSIIERRHPEWSRFRIEWQWLLDSLEGGAAYRYAEYGQVITSGSRTLPKRNLVRHKREYPEPGQPTNTGQPGMEEGGNDYAVRLERTPVPTQFAEAIAKAIGRIFGQEIRRPEASNRDVAGWWEDADGSGSDVTDWMRETVAPLFLALGQIDLAFERPAAGGRAVVTEADVKQAGIDRIYASVLLPTQLVWWMPDLEPGRFKEVLVHEVEEAENSTKQIDRFRHWTDTEWVLYDDQGEVVSRGTNSYGCVPIIRVFDRRRFRCRNVGLSRYLPVADIQKEMYNAKSELILSNTYQAHPILQGPEDYVKGNSEIPIGPGWVFPVKTPEGKAPVPWSVLDFPKGPAESIRDDLEWMSEECDRVSVQVRPNGAQGTVAQSGLSKAFDYEEANANLAQIATSLAKVERAAVEMILRVTSGGKLDEKAYEAIAGEIVYPKDFQLLSGRELADAVEQFQTVLGSSGDAPETEGELLVRLFRSIVPGLDTADGDKYENELREAPKAKAKRREEEAKAAAQLAAVGSNGAGVVPGPNGRGRKPGL